MLILALQKVFRKPTYVLLALVASLIMFAFAVWLPNIRLLASVFSSSDISFLVKLNLPISLLGSIATNFTLLSVSYIIAIAVLLGINLAMVIYYLGRKIDGIQQGGITTGFLGITSGMLGVGCAACGSFILMNILTFIGASWVLSYLPLAGAEFGVLGVMLLVISLYLTAKQILDPAVCNI